MTSNVIESTRYCGNGNIRINEIPDFYKVNQLNSIDKAVVIAKTLKGKHVCEITEFSTINNEFLSKHLPFKDINFTLEKEFEKYKNGKKDYLYFTFDFYYCILKDSTITKQLNLKEEDLILGGCLRVLIGLIDFKYDELWEEYIKCYLEFLKKIENYTIKDLKKEFNYKEPSTDIRGFIY